MKLPTSGNQIADICLYVLVLVAFVWAIFFLLEVVLTIACLAFVGFILWLIFGRAEKL